jgi:ABC-type branched-subunit amino acid transport system ATPase component
MGKTTLCKAIMGLVPVASGTITLRGQPLVGLQRPAEIARLGIGYVPQGRRLWRSLTVDEHLRMVERKGGAWSDRADLFDLSAPGRAQVERRRAAFGRRAADAGDRPRASAEPALLVMDEPTEGLAPVIVAQVEEMLLRLAEDGEIDVLVIEQNIGVACAVADRSRSWSTAGSTARRRRANWLADRDLQQRLLGVGRHGHEDTPPNPPRARASPGRRQGRNARREDLQSNPKPPTRWSQPVPVRRA